MLAGRALAAYVRLVASTARIGGEASLDQAVIALWHEYNLVASVAAHRLRTDQHHVSFTTQTFRGVVMDTMLAALDAGSVPLPAPDDAQGSARLTRELARLGAEGASPVVSPDGPLGPYRVAKPGALIVARESGLAIRPWALTASPSIRLRGRWDRQVVPLPFSRIRVVEGEPITVAPRDRLRPLLGRLQAELDGAAARASTSGTRVRRR